MDDMHQNSDNEKLSAPSPRLYQILPSTDPRQFKCDYERSGQGRKTLIDQRYSIVRTPPVRLTFPRCHPYPKSFHTVYTVRVSSSQFISLSLCALSVLRRRPCKNAFLRTFYRTSITQCHSINHTSPTLDSAFRICTSTTYSIHHYIMYLCMYHTPTVH
ncbi:hypothetical protein ARMSODRAFT_2199 [Armillaria solidipes]|uniref:Uncharacterized protein n=1 Tax=Armillaria solidipes TaxID=1076256 RepID=A0A2H3CLL3_9AGAR|nr:hypothetical protein ARMSODRAFT_2199 [Armillaria solidipes]